MIVANHNNFKDYRRNAIKQKYKEFTDKEISHEDLERCINKDIYLFELAENHWNEIEWQTTFIDSTKMWIWET